jgi:predicted alpha/beta hydrolase family esterase
MSSVVIVPGLHDSGPRHWQTLWQRRLPDSVRVVQQHWDTPDLTRWSNNVATVLNALDDCWIVAHSFGCLASVHAVAQLQGHLPSKVRGLFLVAPADPHKFAIAERLPAGPLTLPARMIASRTDPWLSWASAQQWAQRWRIPLICAGDAGHINAESGHGLWPEGWREFQQLRGLERRPLPSEPRWALAI